MEIPKVKRNISTVFVHCSDTGTHQNFGVKDFRKWHTDPKSKGGRGWSDVGYHYVIRLDGTIEVGRPLYRVGAHAGRKHNHGSIGVCFEGGKHKDGSKWDKPTDAQFHGWFLLYWSIADVYHCLKIRGHYEVSPKTCPNFNVEILR